MRLLAAEALKLRTTWGFWVYLVLMLGITALAVSATIGSGVGAFDDESWRDLLRTPALGFLFPLLLGSVTFTNEFRHGTIGQTLLLTPRRGVLLVLKLVTAALVGLLFAALAFALTLAIALPWLGAKDVEVGIGDPVVRETGLAVALGFVLLAMFGAAVGGALRSQMGAAVGLLVWFLVVELLVGALLTALDIEGVARYLPFSAAGAIVGGEDDAEMLSQGAGAVVLLAWVGGLAGVAAVSLRRDVT